MSHRKIFNELRLELNLVDPDVALIRTTPMARPLNLAHPDVDLIPIKLTEEQKEQQRQVIRARISAALRTTLVDDSSSDNEPTTPRKQARTDADSTGIAHSSQEEASTSSTTPGCRF